jgi:hypothetical protein
VKLHRSFNAEQLPVRRQAKLPSNSALLIAAVFAAFGVLPVPVPYAIYSDMQAMIVESSCCVAMFWPKLY